MVTRRRGGLGIPKPHDIIGRHDERSILRGGHWCVLALNAQGRPKYVSPDADGITVTTLIRGVFPQKTGVAPPQEQFSGDQA